MNPKGEKNRERQTSVSTNPIFLSVGRWQGGKKMKSVLSRIPTYHDFAPSRFVRKLSMVAGWCCVLMIPFLIASVAGTWISVNAHETLIPRTGGIAVNVTTTGTCTLRRCHFLRVSTDGLIDEDISGSPSALTGVNGLDSTGSGVVWLIVVGILACPLSALLCWVHGWARVDDQRRSYVAAASLLFTLTISLIVSWIMYLGAKPTAKDGYSLAWAFFLDLANSFALLAITAVVLFDKPSGLFRLTKQFGSTPFLHFPPIHQRPNFLRAQGCRSR